MDARAAPLDAADVAPQYLFPLSPDAARRNAKRGHTDGLHQQPEDRREDDPAGERERRPHWNGDAVGEARHTYSDRGEDWNEDEEAGHWSARAIHRGVDERH